MTLQIYPFSASESKIDGLRIINVKMVTDDRGTVRELYRESSHSEVLPETLSSWKQINLTRTKRGAVRGLHGEAMFHRACATDFRRWKKEQSIYISLITSGLRECQEQH